jgi:hypothetical protein
LSGPGSRFLWIKWYDGNGAPKRESTRTTSETEARRLLNDRLGSVAKGELVAVHAARLRARSIGAECSGERRG